MPDSSDMLSRRYYRVLRNGIRQSLHSCEEAAIREARRQHERADTSAWEVVAPDLRPVLQLPARRPLTKMQKHAMWIIDQLGGRAEVGDCTNRSLGVVHRKTAESLERRGGYRIVFDGTSRPHKIIKESHDHSGD